jgi:hypothetical protein
MSILHCKLKRSNVYYIIVPIVYTGITTSSLVDDVDDVDWLVID